MDFKPATSEESVDEECDISTEKQDMSDRACDFNIPDVGKSDVSREVSVKLRFLRHGEPKCEQVHECALSADETLQQAGAKFAHAMSGNSVELETKAARVYDSASEEFIAAQLSQAIDGSEKIEVTFEVLGSDADCARFFALITKTSACRNDERNASNGADCTSSQESTDDEHEESTDKTSRIAKEPAIQESLKTGSELAVVKVAKSTEDANAERLTYDPADVRVNNADANENEPHGMPKTFEEESGTITPDSLVIQQHEVSVEMRFLRGGELKHTHAHKCKVTAGKTLGAVAEKFKDCLVGQGAELVQNSLRVQCSKSDSFVEACGSDIADDVARLEITFEVHADADNCERFFAMLKKQPATSPLPQNNRPKSSLPTENPDSETSSEARLTPPILKPKPFAISGKAHQSDGDEATQSGPARPGRLSQEECHQEELNKDEDIAHTVEPVKPGQLEVSVEELVEANHLVPLCREEEKALDACEAVDADGLSVIDIPVTLRFLHNGSPRKILDLTYLCSARETIKDVVKHYGGTYKGQTIDLEVELVSVRRPMLPRDVDSKRLVEADMSELVSGVLQLVIAFEVLGSEVDRYRFFAKPLNQSSSKHMQESGSYAEAANPAAHRVHKTLQRRGSASKLSMVQARRPAKQRKRIYILLLGSTGCGKSTFINGIANYTTFKTLGDACQAEGPLYAIPTEIELWNKNADVTTWGNVTVRIGPEGPKEQFGTGSNTQDVRFHSFLTDDYEIVMMDTPGIGDTDGVHKDQINEQKIVNAISKLPHLNMILMLFKATDNRFSEPYRYCITELLLRLHESTTANIAFCFTHTRCERYTPGQAAGPLKSYLNMLKERHGKVIKWDKTNAFFLDNEAVRFVYGYQSGVGFDQQDLEDSARSWDRSVAEMTRMFRYAASLQPHDVNKTVSMNRAREAVLIFAKPLVDINDLIETNKQLLAEHQAKVAVLEPVIEELRNNLEFMHVAYEREMLDHPRTVCSRCATVETVPNTTEKQVVYTQICHSRCKLPGVALERFPQPGLKKCRAMAWNLRSTCIWCKCGWEHHLHINFSQVKKPRTFKDMRKEEQLHEETDALLLKQRLIADCTRQMGEFLEEQRIIKAASVRFAAYLKQNAILPYNDVYEEYAKLCIENEEMCVRFDRNRDRTKLKNLRRCLAEYRQERDAIIAGIEAGKGVERVDTDDIERCKQQLFGLKHNGAELHKLYDAALAGYEHYKDAGFELTGPKFWDTHGKKKSSKSLMAHAKSAAKHPIKSAAAAYRYLTSE